MTHVESEFRLRMAFPGALGNDVGSVCHLFKNETHQPTDRDIIAIVAADESVRIPYRIYSDVPGERVISALTDRQRIVVSCLLTRHHNGHIRQRFVKRFEGQLCDWLLPFAMELLGEYVHEIAVDLTRIFPMQPDPLIDDFVSRNPQFVATTRRRIISYWSLNSDRVPRFTDYAPYQIFERVGIWDHSLTPCLTARSEN